MKKLLSLGMAAALLVVTSAAFALPTLTGPTGVVDTPTADVAAPGQFTIAADWYDFGAADWYDFGIESSSVNLIPIRLNYGVAPNFEVGAMYTVSDGDGSDAWGLNAKYMTPFTLGDAEWSIGASYWYWDMTDADLSAIQGYFVGTKSFTPDEEGNTVVKGSLGISYTNYDAEVDSEGAFRVFANLEATFANKLSVGAEFQLKDSDIEDDPLSSIVIRYPFTPALTGQVGFTNSLLGRGSPDHNIFAGLAYTFGGQAEEDYY